MKTTRVLMIAPYAGMAELAEKIAKKRSDITLTTYVGDLEAGASLAEGILQEDYDAVISRGGTAELLRQRLRIPVIQIRLSEYDMLRVLLLAKNCGEPYAVMGFSDVIECIRLVNALLEDAIPTRVLHSRDEVRKELLALKENGITLVVGDAVTVTTAREIGLSSILITSGEESISAAFDMAVQTKQARAEADTHCEMLYEVLDHCSLDFVVFNGKNKVVYQKCRLLDSNTLIELTSHYVRQLKLSDHFELSTKCGDTFVRLDGYTWQTEEPLYVFYCKIGEAQAVKGIGPMQRPVPELWTAFELFYANCDSMRDLTRQATALTGLSAPVLIQGAPGTLAECFAWELYQNGPLQEAPCFIVDCASLTSRNMQFLTDNINSPFYNNGITVFVKDLHLLEEEKQGLLLAYLNSTSLNTRNRMIYSIAPPCRGNLVAEALLSSTNCQLLSLPSLCERRSEMQQLAGICLGEIDVRLGRQKLGVQPDAMEQLLQYDWPQNITQFMRVLTACAIGSDSSDVEPADLRNALRQETMAASECSGGTVLPRGTLEEIEQYIVARTLKEEEMNQSRAAKRLGISRSTLWRMLKCIPN